MQQGDFFLLMGHFRLQEFEDTYKYSQWGYKTDVLTVVICPTADDMHCYQSTK